MHQEQIIQWLRSRDDRGMEALLKHYGPLLRYIIAPILPQMRDQEECISEAAMRIWERIDSFDESKGSWTAWITAIARNLALNRARDLKRRQTEPIPENTVSPEPGPEEQMLLQQRRRVLAEAINQLAAADRLLFFRKYYYLQSTRQIAAELGLTERAVEGRLYRIKKQLRRVLGGAGYDR